MENIFVEFLPPWVETGIQPAFYDKESGTVLQQTARMYARVNMLVRMFNKLSKNTKTVVEDYIDKFNELHDYVHDYFDNLDVQEEIDHKLDEMLENGQLADIVAGYIQLRGVLAYDTVADLKSATNIVDGSFAETYGYHSAGDGGSMKYKIREIINTDVVDEMKIIALADENLVAEAIIPEVVNPEMFGAYGDGVHDDYNALDCVFNLDSTLVCPSNKTYLSNSGITMTKRKSVNFGLSTIKFTNNGVGLTINTISESTYSHKRFSPVIENLVLDGYNNTKVMYIINAYKGVIRNIYVNNFRNIGIEKADEYGTLLDDVWCWASNQNTTSIGLLVSSNDGEFGNIYGMNCHTGVKITGSANHFKRVHFWLFNDIQGDGLADGDALYHESSMIDIANNDRTFFDYVYVDSYQYGFKYSGYGYVTLNSGFVLCPDLTSMTANFTSYPFYFIYADGENLKYLWRFSVNNLVFQQNNIVGLTLKMIPDGYEKKPIRVTNSFIYSAYNNIPTDYIDQFTLSKCTNTDLHATFIDNNSLRVHGVLQKSDEAGGWSIGMPDYCSPISANEIVPCINSNSRWGTGTSDTSFLTVGNYTIGEASTTVNNNYYYIDTTIKVNYQ